jgi:hypothetical protein
MMNRAVSGGSGPSQPGARENVAYLTSTERRRAFEPVPPPAPAAPEVSACIRGFYHSCCFSCRLMRAFIIPSCCSLQISVDESRSNKLNGNPLMKIVHLFSASYCPQSPQLCYLSVSIAVTIINRYSNNISIRSLLRASNLTVIHLLYWLT